MYQQLKPLAESLGTWGETQPVLLQLARSDEETLAHIYLFEEQWDAALKLAQEKSLGDLVLVRLLVAREVKQHRPHAALMLLRALVQDFINLKDRASYANAADYAAEIKDIYRNILHDEDAWQTYITELRNSNKRRRALLEEFRAL